MKLLLLVSLISLVTVNSQAANDAPLSLLKTIPLPGVKGKFDHLAVDIGTQRVFIAAKANNTLEVVDLAGGIRAQSVAGFSEPQGVLFLGETNQVVVANGGSGEVQILNATSMKVTRRFAVGEDADNIRFDAATRRVYVACKDGALSTVDLKSATVSEVPLSAHPEAFSLEPDTQRMFVCVPKADSVLVLDRQSEKIIAQWKLMKAKVNYTCDLDAASKRLFVGCRKPASVVVIDTTSGLETTSFPIGGETDDLIFDATHRRLYSIGGAGTIDVIAQVDADHYQTLAQLTTAPLARTGAYVPELDQLLIAVPAQGGREAELRVYQAHQ